MSPVSLTAVAVLLAGIGAVLQSTMLAMIGRRSGALAATTLAAIVGLIGITAFTFLVNRSLAGVAEAARQSPWIWVPAGLLGIGGLAPTHSPGERPAGERMPSRRCTTTGGGTSKTPTAPSWSASWHR